VRVICLRSVVAVVCLFLFVSFTSAQAPSSSQPLPYSTNIGSDIDHVDLGTGTLNITIPFISVPGKHMEFDFGLSYNPGFWTPQLQVNGTFKWALPPANMLLIKGTNIVGWQGTQGSVAWSRGPAFCVNNSGQEPISGQETSIFYTTGGTQDNGYFMSDRHGSGHAFLVNYFNSGECDQGVPSGQFNSSNLEGPSSDMDGFYATLGVTGNTISIFGPDGTNYGGAITTQPTASGGYADTTTGAMFGDEVAEADAAGNSQSVAPGYPDSLGRTPVTQTVSGNQIFYTVQDSTGASQMYTVTFANQALEAPYGSGTVQAINQAGTNADQLITSIQPPQGNPYRFQYDASGTLTQLTLPSGAVIKYMWSQTSAATGASKVVTQRTVTHDGGVTDVWDIDQSNPQAGVTLVGPADSTGARYMSVYTFDQSYHVLRVQYLNGQTRQSPLALQYDVTWDTLRAPADGSMTSNGLMTSLTTTLENGMVSQKTYDYDLYSYPHQTLDCGDKGSGFFTCLNLSAGDTDFNGVPFNPDADQTHLPPPTPFPGSHGNVTGIREYGWGQGAPGPLLRQTIRRYLHDQNSNYFAYAPAIPAVHGRAIRNIVNRVVDEAVYDGSALCSGAATWVGDGTGNITPARTCTANKLAETITTYDNGAPDTYGYKGLPTSVSHWIGGSSYISSSTTYDASGNPQTVVDPLNHTTTYGYANAFSSAGSCGIPANSSGYLTSVTDAAGETTSQTYNGCTGSVASSTDANGAVSSFGYDWKGRETSVANPDGGHATTTYNDTALTVTTDQQMNASQVREIVTQVDQLGRAAQTRLTTDPAGILYADTVYDAFGRVVSSSNPYHSTSDSTYGVTRQTYDVRGRKVTQKNPDGSITTLSYAGNVTTITDENGHAHTQTTDALGRLTNVVEPGGLSTDYTYDPLGNLTLVNQHGLTTETARKRSFSYGPLSRLLQSNNPETGAINYTYDADGNLTAKTDARNVTTTYIYDPVNRLLTKSYSGADANSDTIAANTPPVTFTYGTTSAPAGMVGRLMSEITGPANSPITQRTITGYDSMGRILSEQQTLHGGTPNSFQYMYDLAGDVTYSNDGVSNSGVGLTSSYDGAGHLKEVVDMTPDGPTHPAILFSTPTGYPQTPQYGPAGLVNAAIGVFSTTSQEIYQQQRVYDNRMRITGETDALVNAIQEPGNPATASAGTIAIGGVDGSTENCGTGGGGLNASPQSLSASTSQAAAPQLVRCTTVPDTGEMVITVGSFSATASYGSGSTATSLANALALAFNQAGSPVKATVSNGVITLASTTTGSATNYSMSVSTSFSGSSPDFNGTPSAATMTGGSNASVITIPSGTVMYSYNSASYDPVSNLTSVSDSVMGHWAYGYDSLNRLISGQASANAGTTFAPYGSGLLQWSYDSFGNFKGQTFSGSSSAMVNQGSYAYTTPDNRISGVSYDATGNVLSNGITGFSYDAEGRVATATGFSYIYDAEGNRVAKMQGATVVNRYLLGSGGEQVAELNGSNQWMHSNAYAAGILLGTYDANGLHFHFTDWLGTRRVQALAAGVIEQNCLSLPFGDSLNCTGSDSTDLHFTGKERDAESGLDYFGARYYGSNMGRFMSPDPSGLVFADPTNPQSFNLYSYVLNNPLVNVDPNGLDCVHIDNDTGKFISANRGDCDNSTEASANTGHYFDGHLDALYTTDGTTNGAITGLAGTNESGLSLYSGGPAATTPKGAASPIEAVDAPSYQLSPYAQAVFGQVAQRTAWVPTVCSVGAYAQYGVGPIATGVSYDSNKGTKQYTAHNVAPELAPFSLTTKVDSKGGVSVGGTLRDPETRIGAGLSINQNGVPTASASWAPGPVTVGVTATGGTIGNPQCQSHP
jgi:RHS repeat-associated protein